ncbi:5-oxoprolinase subunit PxpA [Flavisolibacter tropicus]|uniref:LamB/YcsF family protein n=1 Tax=Flavisolibacter tropicus TaxID=1492898 RepID=A0A172TXI4_9BACT|nr:5-oxoprolinase subunit PxpA [Flavisolibacter tropicus]ANE51716.1 LamB/YcsF family protein [Flavisolibacter tropicus]
MQHVDLNCDMGEGIGNDEQLMPYITSANIACGYHAGDAETMMQTLQLCKQFRVAAGAHPSFPDRANFGRLEMSCTPVEVYQWVQLQVQALQLLASQLDINLVHVKPHGALYNQAAREQQLAAAIAQAVKDIDPHLIVVGLSGSYLITEAETLGLTTASEVFADRTYQDDGSLTPRTQPGALIEEEAASIQQVLQMVKQGSVMALSGKDVPLKAETICLHGDGIHATRFAKALRKTLESEGITIQSLQKAPL